MKREFKKIVFTDYGYSELLPASIANLTHYKITRGGVFLYSNKNFKYLSEMKIFVPFNEIRIIY